MPHINIFTYLSQTTWTILLFVIYYINMKQVLLPSLLENLKLKNSSFENSLNLSSDLKNYSFSYLNLLVSVVVSLLFSGSFDLCPPPYSSSNSDFC